MSIENEVNDVNVATARIACFRSAPRRLLPRLLASALALSFVGAALAGPPLVCHTFETGGAKSLPWGDPSRGFEAALADYPLSHLADDTMALLAPDTPVIVRMETLRRASIYAARDAGAREALLSRLVARTKEGSRDPARAGLAWFDVGYTIETLLQVGDGASFPRRVLEAIGLVESAGAKGAAGLDGYDLVQRALSMRGDDPSMEYAAALITSHPRRSTYEQHLARAAAGAKEGSLLETNLLRSFPDRGKTLAEQRASASRGKR